jgi:hypothetical protein
MPSLDLHLACPNLNVTDLSLDANTVPVDAVVVTPTAACPDRSHDSPAFTVDLDVRSRICGRLYYRGGYGKTDRLMCAGRLPR